MKLGTIIVILFIVLIVLLPACAGTINTKEKPVLQAVTVQGEHAQLAGCVTKLLLADPRTFMRMFHYKSRVYPDLAATEIHAYDTRFLPYVYASNSPNNPDAVRDYATPSPELMHNAQHLVGAEHVYGFAFLLQQTGENQVAVTLKGNPHIGRIAWDHFGNCTAGSR